MSSLSIWEKESFYATKDIVIVGAGLMGLWTALELKTKKPTLQITILERNSTPLGASTRNAGFACFGSPTELLEDAATIGEEEMWKNVEARYKGIRKIRQHFSDAEIQFDECGGYECLLTQDQNVSDKLHWLNKGLQIITGNAQNFIKADEELSTLGLQGFSSLIKNKYEAALHSGFLVKKLMEKVQELGVQILYGAEVTSWQNNSSFTEVILRDIKIKTAHLIFCTNAFTNSLIPEINIKPARGQVIVTSPIANLSLKGTFHFDMGFYYWRNLGNKILLGGARNIAIDAEQTTDLSTSNTIQAQLEYFLQTHLASQYQYTIEHRWSGIMGFSENKNHCYKKFHQKYLLQ